MRKKICKMLGVFLLVLGLMVIFDFNFVEASSSSGHVCKWGAWRSIGSSSHRRTCSGCGKQQARSHLNNNGYCSACGYCSHSFTAWIREDNDTHVRTCNGCKKRETGSHAFGTDGKCTLCHWVNVAISCNHKGSWKITETTHTKNCSLCGVLISKGNHTPNDGGYCATCGYCKHLKTTIEIVSDEEHSEKCNGCNRIINTVNHVYSQGKCKCGHACKHGNMENGFCNICNYCIHEKTQIFHEKKNHIERCMECTVEVKKIENVVNEENICSICEKDINACLHRTYEWINKGDKHEKICLKCEEKLLSGAHTPDDNGKCTLCQYQVEETCDHSFSNWYDAGSVGHSRVCSICKEMEIKKHAYRWQTITKATCTKTGLKIYICRNCGNEDKLKTETIPLIEHKFNSLGICKECGFEDKTKVTCTESNKIKGHKYETLDYKYINEETHERTERCIKCDITFKRVENHPSKSNTCKCGYAKKCGKNILATGHTTTTKYEKYNTRNHKEIQYCEVCKVKVSTKVVEHNNEITNDLTYRYSKCQDCGYEKRVGHDNQKIYTPKDSTYHEVKTTCKNCKISFGTTLDYHKPYKNGKCRCGEENYTIPDEVDVFEDKVIEVYKDDVIDLSDVFLGGSLSIVKSKKDSVEFGVDGVLIANKAGETIIQIKIGNVVVDEIKVIVKNEKLETTTKGITIKEGEGGNVPIEVKTANKDTATVVYTSSNPKLVTVNPDGTFTTNEEYLSDGKSEKVTITATTVNSKGKTVTATYTVTVTAKDVYYNEYQNGKANVAVIEPEKSSENKEEKLPGVVIYFGGDGTLRTNFTGNNGHTQYMENSRNGAEYEDYIFTVQSTEDGDSASAKSAKDVIPILRQLVKEGKIDPENIKVVGHSRGGIATTNLLKEMEKEENSDLKISEAIIVDGAYTDNLDTYTKAMDNGTKLQIYASDLDNRNIAQSSRKVVEELSSREEYSDMFVGQEVEGENHSTVLTCDLVSAAIDELAGKM